MAPQRTSHLRPGFWQRFLRFHLYLALTLTALVIAVLIAGGVARHRLASRYPPAGRMVDVGGHRLHLVCSGTGGPTVVLESGMNEFSLSWSAVQPDIAKFTRVCSYDRAGLGWSEPGPSPPASETIVRELHALLSTAGIDGPLVLVGHSFGGMTIRLYARRYPDEVVGMVLVDSAHEAPLDPVRDAIFRKFHRKLLTILKVGSFLSRTGVFALAPGLIPDRGLPPAVVPSYRAVLASTDYFTAALKESSAWEESAAEIRAERIESLGDIPLVVMGRGLPQPLPGITDAEYRELDKDWKTLQARMLRLSTRSRLIIATKSDHFIQLREPALVVDAVRDVWEQARRQQTKTSRHRDTENTE